MVRFINIAKMNIHIICEINPCDCIIEHDVRVWLCVCVYVNDSNDQQKHMIEKKHAYTVSLRFRILNYI